MQNWIAGTHRAEKSAPLIPRSFVYPSAKECYPPCQWVLQYKGERIIDEWVLRQKTVDKSRKYYTHFDARTDMKKTANLVTDAKWVSHHGFYPLIHYKKDCSKYSSKGRKQKERDICYAAHLDRCILQYYCHVMNERYNTRIRNLGIEDVPVAYRSDLGKNNIHLAKHAFDYIKASPNAYVMIGDFTGFFDNLDHQYLKQQWCNLLGVDQLPPDHYTIFKNITRYSTWELDDLLKLNGLPMTSAGRKKLNSQYTVLTKEQYKKYRSHIKKHTDSFGIPQGSPISALLANVYMMDVDRKIKDIVEQCAGLYMRYSDDFLVVLPLDETAARTAIFSINHIIDDTPGLTLEPQKTQIYKIDLPYIENIGGSILENADGSKSVINFLGFTFNGITITLRSKTVSKYYYRMYRKAHAIAENPDQKGKDHLYQEYSERGAKPTGKNKGNFFTYVHRAERVFGNVEEIQKPVKNHMAKIRRALKKPQN